MSDFVVVQDIYKSGHVIFEGDEAAVYIYLKRWNFPESSMVWVVDADGKKTGSTEWFNAERRKLIAAVVDEALDTMPNCYCYQVTPEEIAAQVEEATDKIVSII